MTYPDFCRVEGLKVALGFVPLARGLEPKALELDLRPFLSRPGPLLASTSLCVIATGEAICAQSASSFLN